MRRGGFGVSRTTPAEIVDKLNTVVNRTSRIACRLRQPHRRRDRKVGQGDQIRGHQPA